MNTPPIKAVKFKHSISTRLLKIVLSIYFLLTFLVTGVHIFIEYNAAKGDIQQELEVTELTFKNILSSAMWNMNDTQLQVTAEGISNMPSVIGIEIKDPYNNLVLRVGDAPTSDSIASGNIFWHEFSLQHERAHANQLVGHARIISNSHVVFNRIKLGILILIIGAVIKTVALVLLITIVFNRLLTRPLGKLANDADKIDLNDSTARHIKIIGHEESELKILESALNNMMDKIVNAMLSLDELNKELEKKVTERTQSLNQTVKQLDIDQQELKKEVAIRQEKEKALIKGRLDLQRSLDELKQTQDQLIESEKMASLGELVAGVAHEINTPVGLSLTGISHFQYMLTQLETRFQENELEESHFEKFISDAKEISKSIHISLERAAGLVKSFKQVAVDQTHEMVRWFNVSEYIDEVMLSLQNKIKHTPISVKIECDKDINIKGYPGSLSQIITNFINNSLIHAYKKDQKGTITLTFKTHEQDLHFCYSDDGNGQGKEIESKMFLPFFTTNREEGGSGLGLNIVYNLVTQKMKGSINVESIPDIGTTFTIIIPIDVTTTGLQEKR